MRYLLFLLLMASTASAQTDSTQGKKPRRQSLITPKNQPQNPSQDSDGNAAKADLSAPLVSYSEVIQLDSTLSKDELYRRAKQWFVLTYKDSKSVLQLDDKSSGQLVGKATMKYNSSVFSGSASTSGYTDYTLSVFVKDGRYKYEMTNFIHDGTGNSTVPKGYDFGLITTSDASPYVPWAGSQNWATKVWKDIKTQMDINAKATIVSLKDAMQKTSGANENDW